MDLKKFAEGKEPGEQTLSTTKKEITADGIVADFFKLERVKFDNLTPTDIEQATLIKDALLPRDLLILPLVKIVCDYAIENVAIIEKFKQFNNWPFYRFNSPSILTGDASQSMPPLTLTSHPESKSSESKEHNLIKMNMLSLRQFTWLGTNNYVGRYDVINQTMFSKKISSEGTINHSLQLMDGNCLLIAGPELQIIVDGHLNTSPKVTSPVMQGTYWQIGKNYIAAKGLDKSNKQIFCIYEYADSTIEKITSSFSEIDIEHLQTGYCAENQVIVAKYSQTKIEIELYEFDQKTHHFNFCTSFSILFKRTGSSDELTAQRYAKICLLNGGNIGLIYGWLVDNHINLLYHAKIEIYEPSKQDKHNFTLIPETADRTWCVRDMNNIIFAPRMNAFVVLDTRNEIDPKTGKTERVDYLYFFNLFFNKNRYIWGREGVRAPASFTPADLLGASPEGAIFYKQGRALAVQISFIIFYWVKIEEAIQKALRETQLLFPEFYTQEDTPKEKTEANIIGIIQGYATRFFDFQTPWVETIQSSNLTNNSLFQSPQKTLQSSSPANLHLKAGAMTKPS